MPTFTQTVAAAAAAFLSIRREALTALGYDAYGSPDKSYVGLHTPDTDPIARIQDALITSRSGSRSSKD